MNTEELAKTLSERGETHGRLEAQAALAERLKAEIRNVMPGVENLNSVQRQSLDMICLKISRIVCGNPDEPDHWLDIEGYARLVRERL